MTPGQVVLVRCRIAAPHAGLPPLREGEWACEQVGRNGGDIPGASPVWAMAGAIVTIEEAKAALSGRKGGSDAPKDKR